MRQYACTCSPREIAPKRRARGPVPGAISRGKAGLVTRFGQGLDEVLPAHVVHKDILGPLATAHDACPAVASAKADGKWRRDILLGVGAALRGYGRASGVREQRRVNHAGLARFRLDDTRDRPL